MSKKIIVVNAGPRKGWNTDTLITEASRGAEAAGATVERFDLFRLEKYTGCISCFGCKKEKNKGRCICRDGLTPVLDAIRESDGLIIGSPNYLSEFTASFRALYERLIFQNLTYNLETPCCNPRPIPVLLIMTSNAPDTAYMHLVQNYQQTASAPARATIPRRSSSGTIPSSRRNVRRCMRWVSRWRKEETNDLQA